MSLPVDPPSQTPPIAGASKSPELVVKGHESPEKSTDTKLNEPDRPRFESLRQVPVATIFAFVLCLACSAALTFGLARFFGILDTPPKSTFDLLFLTKAGVLALAIVTAISCVVLGFAAFMIGAKGEFKLRAENSVIKGILNSGAPGLFFVLAGTVIMCMVLNVTFTYEGEVAGTPSSTVESDLKGGPSAGADSKDLSPVTTPPPSSRSVRIAGRGIASENAGSYGPNGPVTSSGGILMEDYEEEMTGFFLENEALLDALKSVATAPEITDEVVEQFRGTWMAEGDGLHVVKIQWKTHYDIPADHRAFDQEHRGRIFQLMEGTLVMPTKENYRLVEWINSLRSLVGFGRQGNKEPDLPWKDLLSELAPKLRETVILHKGKKIALLPEPSE